jgi:hypothetical protein
MAYEFTVQFDRRASSEVKFNRYGQTDTTKKTPHGAEDGLVVQVSGDLPFMNVTGQGIRQKVVPQYSGVITP